MQIKSSAETFSPLCALRPFTVTRFSEIRRSASLLEHTPASLKYLLILIFSSICLLYNFFARTAMGNSLVFFGQLLYDKNECDRKRQKSAGQIRLKNSNKGGTFMQGRKMRTSRPLMLLALLLCVIIGAVFTKSSANPSPLDSESMSEMFVADKPEESLTKEDSAKADSDQPTDNSRKKSSDAAMTPTPSPTSEPSAPKESEASPEASAGVWTASGSDWLFMVDGSAYKGWLTDTDGKRYFFNDDGIMQRGWLDNDGRRYYFDLDGIMQTGKIKVKDKTYELNQDGSLKGYKASEKKKKTEKKASEEKKNSKKEKKYAALTFDDGPGSFTGRLLDCLEKNKAKATFFMVGKEIASFPDEVKRMAELGFELGNHTYDHKDLTTLSLAEIQSEIGRVDQTLLELTGQGASVVRPPYGSIDDNVKASVGTPMILWSIDTLDWKTLDVQQTVDTVMNEVRDGSIILMHDIYSTTVDAAEILIPKLIKEGYELVTIHELAKIKGIELNPGIAYGEMN